MIMPKQQTIKFSIRQDGTVTEEVMDAASQQCLDLTESIEKKLGGLQPRSFKPEFYHPAIVNEHVSLQHNQNENQEQT